jgi:hypothetical protein
MHLTGLLHVPLLKGASAKFLSSEMNESDESAVRGGANSVDATPGNVNRPVFRISTVDKACITVNELKKQYQCSIYLYFCS